MNTLLSLINSEAATEHTHRDDMPCINCRIMMGVMHNTLLASEAARAVSNMIAGDTGDMEVLLTVCIRIGMRLQQEIDMRALLGEV